MCYKWGLVIKDEDVSLLNGFKVCTLWTTNNLSSRKKELFLPPCLHTSDYDDNDNEFFFGKRSSKLAILIIREVKKEVEDFFW